MTRSQGYKTFFMLNSTGHEIRTAHNHYDVEKYRQAFLALNSQMLRNLFGILTFISMAFFILS